MTSLTALDFHTCYLQDVVACAGPVLTRSNKPGKVLDRHISKASEKIHKRRLRLSFKPFPIHRSTGSIDII